MSTVENVEIHGEILEGAKPETGKSRKVIEYSVGVATVRILDVGGKGYYLVEEPRLDGEAKQLLSRIREYIYKYMRVEHGVEDPASLIEEYMWRAARDSGLEEALERHLHTVRYYILRDTIGYGKLDVIMRDPMVEELAVEGPYVPVAVVHREASEYRWLDSNIVFHSEEELRSYVQRLALRGGRSISTANPIVEVKLPEGHRAALTYSREVSGRGSSLVIRKFPEKPLTITHLLVSKTLSLEEAAYLWKLIEAQQLIFIIGAMASGKTTVLQALTSLIPPDSRVVTVEDSPELRLHHEHWDPLYTRRSIGGLTLDITIDDLLKFALRRRAEYIIVGEVRGEEVRALVQAAASGHGGLTTLHSDSVESMMIRLRSPPLNVKEAFLSTIGSVVVMRRVRIGGKAVRRVSKVAEITPGASVAEVFRWQPATDQHLPATIEELPRKSWRLRAIMERESMTEREMVEDLKDKMAVLRMLVDNRLYDYEDVAREIIKYYSSRVL